MKESATESTEKQITDEERNILWEKLKDLKKESQSKMRSALESARSLGIVEEIKRREEIMARRQKFMAVLMILPTFVAIVLYVYYILLVRPMTSLDVANEAIYQIAKRKELYILISVLALITVSVGSALMRYLQGGFTFKARIAKAQDAVIEAEKHVFEAQINKTTEDTKWLKKTIDQLKSTVDEQIKSKTTISDDERKEFIETLKTKLETEASAALVNDFEIKFKNKSDNLLKRFEKQLKDKIEKDTYLSHIDKQYEDSIGRLKLEIDALSRRGNLNLVLGIITTIVGLGVLGIFVWKLPEQPTHPWQIAENFLPRLSLVVLIELFAYFFLKLYKSSLSEIKYFQNELSNFEAKFVSLRLALMDKDRDVFDEVIKNLSRTERNYILEKGQSTVELERQKLDKDHFLDAINALPEKMKKVLTK